MADDRAVALAIKGQLDNLVVSIELTLVSIVQGCALSALIGVVQAAIAAGDWHAAPALLTSLLLILIFWSRAVVHTLSFIRWPIDFLHNFLYIAVTLVEVLTIDNAGDARAWFAGSVAYSLAGWVLYTADFSLLRREAQDFVGPKARRLYDDLLRDQRLNIRFLLPASAAFHLFAWWGAGRGWGFGLSLVQLTFYAAYLVDGVLALRRRQGLILQVLVDQAEGEGVVVTSTEAGMDVGGDRDGVVTGEA